MIPRKNKYKEWHEPVKIPGNCSFGVLSICEYLLKQININNLFEQRLKSLFDNYSDINIIKQTFPQDWENSQIWKN